MYKSTHQALDLASTAVDLARDTGDRRLDARTLTTKGTVRHLLKYAARMPWSQSAGSCSASGRVGASVG